MDSISASSSYSSIVQSVLANQDTRSQFEIGVMKAAQESDKQQGAAAVQLIEAAGHLVDVRA